MPITLCELFGQGVIPPTYSLIFLMTFPPTLMVTVAPFFAGILKALLPDFAEYVFVAPPETDTTMAAALQVETFLPFTTFVVQVLAKLEGTLTETLADVPFRTAVAVAAGTFAIGATNGLVTNAVVGCFGDASGTTTAGAVASPVAGTLEDGLSTAGGPTTGLLGL